MNARRHGLTAQHVTLFDETEEVFRQFHLELIACCSRKTRWRAQLSQRAILCAWRSRRVYRIEIGMFAKARKAGRPAAQRWPPILTRSTRAFHRNVTTSRSYRATRRASNARFDGHCSISSAGKHDIERTMMAREFARRSALPIADLEGTKLSLLTCPLTDSHRLPGSGSL